jgi:hypothetical protein
MVWMAGRELLPEALAQAPRRLVWAAGLISFAVMLAFQALLL